MSKLRLFRVIEDRQFRRNAIDFQIRDKKGREVGVAVVTFTRDIEPTERSGYHYPNLEYVPQTVYMAKVQQIRDREDFGASQEVPAFTSPEEREEWIIKRIDGSRYRALKNFG